MKKIFKSVKNNFLSLKNEKKINRKQFFIRFLALLIFPIIFQFSVLFIISSLNLELFMNYTILFFVIIILPVFFILNIFPLYILIKKRARDYNSNGKTENFIMITSVIYLFTNYLANITFVIDGEISFLYLITILSGLIFIPILLISIITLLVLILKKGEPEKIDTFPFK